MHQLLSHIASPSLRVQGHSACEVYHHLQMPTPSLHRLSTTPPSPSPPMGTPVWSTSSLPSLSVSLRSPLEWGTGSSSSRDSQLQKVGTLLVKEKKRGMSCHPKMGGLLVAIYTVHSSSLNMKLIEAAALFVSPILALKYFMFHQLY